MNLELKVKHFNNEDVIATSSELCDKHADARHAYICAEYTPGDDVVLCDLYGVGKTTGVHFNQALYSNFDTTEYGTWCYWNGSKYVACDGNHDGYEHVIH